MPDYPNGSVPASALSPLDGQPGAFLRTDAAISWNRARLDVFERTGITLTVNGWNRTLAEQEQLFFERYEPLATGAGPYNDVRWYKGVRYARMRGAAAAIPGTSNHGWGIAVDVVDYGVVGQFNHPRRTATFPILAEHGWTDTEGRGSIQEPWHLVYDPTRDTQENDMTPGQAYQLAQTLEHAGENRRMLGVILGWNPPASANEATAIAKLWGNGTNSTQTRRTLGALLDGQDGQSPETDARDHLDEYPATATD
ncbi:D-alanyl-D-alanine carboxypeptidase family protein [Oerskovia sp. NPDC060287]|uniref:D-alanyl-D-alanine carboxypeptidase family protein n=1 Tax=Oerskovia sp. NPDC060287 TaxID=3347095 RepID=UPI0036627B71